MMAKLRLTPSIAVRTLAGVVVLAIIFFTVMGWWGDYRAAVAPEDSSKESTAAPEPGSEETKTEGSEAAPEAEAEAQGSGQSVVVLVDGLNFRREAARDSELIRGLTEGSKLAHIATENGWYKVKDADGTVGYISASTQYSRLE